jgi:hypothetical protein
MFSSQILFVDSFDLKQELFPTPKNFKELLQTPVTDEWVRDKIEKKTFQIDSAIYHQGDLIDDNIKAGVIKR